MVSTVTASCSRKKSPHWNFGFVLGRTFVGRTPKQIALIVFGAHLLLLLGLHATTTTLTSNTAPVITSSLMEEEEQVFVHQQQQNNNSPASFETVQTTNNVNTVPFTPPPSVLVTTKDDWESSVPVPGPFVSILCVALGVLAFELLDFLVKSSGKWCNSKQIPVRGKHLDVLTAKDWVFIGASKAGIAPFFYIYFGYSVYDAERMAWGLSQLTLANTLGAFVALFVVYDFFYTILHYALHIKAIYGWVHKHHHIQKAPSRGNLDAVNVHPIEFVLGEYNHLLALYLVSRVVRVHFLTSFAFLSVGGVLAGLNHTRFDVVVPFFGWVVYDSKVHDVHHRIPQSNYGQYTMLWDYIFGTYRPYNPHDRVNPQSQLDETTGKSIAYAEINSNKKNT